MLQEEKNQPPNQPPCGQFNRKGQKEDSHAQCLVRFLIYEILERLFCQLKTG